MEATDRVSHRTAFLFKMYLFERVYVSVLEREMQIKGKGKDGTEEEQEEEKEKE